MAARLTDLSIKNMRSQTRRTEIPDNRVTGLYLIVQPSGAKSWAIRYRHQGKPKKCTLGRYPALELAHARSVARKMLERVDRGDDPSADRREQKQRKAAETLAAERLERDRFASIADQFVEKHAKPRNRTWQETKSILNRNVLPAWGDRSISEIRRRDVIDLLDTIADRAPIQANRTLATVRKLFAWAVQRDILEVSPCVGVKAPSPEKARDRVLTNDELAAVWRASDGLGWPFGPVVQMLVLTGQRRDEVGGLRWSELDLPNRLWTIPRRRAKNDVTHEVPLAPSVVTLLKSLPRFSGCDLVFTTNGEKAASGYSRAKTRLDGLIVKAAGKQAEESGNDPDQLQPLPPWRFHDLRRTMASGMARLGIDLPVIEKILNHSSGTFSGIVGVYQRHSYSDEKRAALEAWARKVEVLTSEAPPNVVPLRSEM